MVYFSMEEFISQGLSLLEVLVELGLAKPTINAIYYTTFMFLDCHKYLLDSIR